MNRFDKRMIELSATPGPGHAVATEEQLQNLERTIGHELPNVYREFLRDYNGYVVLNGVAIPEPTEDGQEVAFVGSFLGFGTDEERNLLANFQWDRERIPDGLMTIAAGDNGYICISIAGGNRESVFFWKAREGDAYGYRHMYWLAGSFEEFVNLIGMPPR